MSSMGETLGIELMEHILLLEGRMCSCFQILQIFLLVKILIIKIRFKY